MQLLLGLVCMIVISSPQHATANYGCLYMAQGVGSVLGGPIAALLHQSTGSWIPVFAVIITMDFLTAALAIFAL